MLRRDAASGAVSPPFGQTKQSADRDFVHWTLIGARPQLEAKGNGSTFAAIKKADLESLPVNLPPLDEQRRIVDLLNRAVALKGLAEQARAKAREVVPALFARMFDHVATEWPLETLSDVSEIRSGITKGRKPKGPLQSVPYLRVANVQDGYLDLSTVKEIEATAEEIARYALAPGDLLLTEGGDPDKLGRGAIWEGQVEPCIHQNHVFAVRVDRSRLLPGYAAAVASSAYGKAYFLSVAKRTTGIASINKTQLGRFPLPVPPLALQQEFVSRVDHIASAERLAKGATLVANQTSAALMSRLFAS